MTRLPTGIPRKKRSIANVHPRENDAASVDDRVVGPVGGPVADPVAARPGPSTAPTPLRPLPEALDELVDRAFEGVTDASRGLFERVLVLLDAHPAALADVRALLEALHPEADEADEEGPSL